jgi:hypothetical protein
MTDEADFLTGATEYWSNTFLAQMAHFFSAATVMLLGDHWHWAGWFCPTLLVSWGLGKEFIFDPAIEGQEFWGSVLDFSFYMIGMVCAGLVIWLT